MGPTKLRGRHRGRRLCLVAIAGVVCGPGAACGPAPTRPDANLESGWIRIVQPTDGDSLSGWIDIVADVDLGELVHRVTFFVDDAPIVVATQTPWATDWLLNPSRSGTLVRLRAEASGARGHAVSPTVTVWIAPRGNAPARIVGPLGSDWIERSPAGFLEMESPGSTPWAATTRWTGSALPREFLSERLPVSMLPLGRQRIRAERPGDAASSWVHPFDYSGSETALAATLDLALALRARDPDRTASFLSTDARLEVCGNRSAPPLAGGDFSTELGRFLVDRTATELSWDWRPERVGQWIRHGQVIALVRAHDLRWSFRRTAGPGPGDPPDWEHGRGATIDLIWTQLAGSRWVLETWREHDSVHGGGLRDLLLRASPRSKGERVLAKI